jgi:hypothetical protein
MIEFINMVFAGDRLADFADELGRALVEADHRRFGQAPVFRQAPPSTLRLRGASIPLRFRNRCQFR